MRRPTSTLLTFLLLLVAAPSAHAVSTLCFVNGGATGANDGTSWANAYTELEYALNDGGCGVVWIAKGVYKPVVPADLNAVTDGERQIGFRVRPGMQVYGGFAGSESVVYDPATDPNRAANIAANRSVLSGDIDGNDAVDANGIDTDTTKIAGSNSYHVVVIDGTTAAGTATASTMIDGVTISGGDADGSSDPLDLAGGLYCMGAGAGHECSPTLTHVSFIGNYASYYGGALYDDGESGGVSSPSLAAVTFDHNRADISGGAMWNNSAGNNSPGTTSPTLVNVTFSSNFGGGYAGAMFNYGGDGVCNPALTNVTFNGNGAGDYAGAIYNFGGCHLTLSNSILWGDASGLAYPEIRNYSTATATFDHSILQASHGSGAGWDATLGSDGGGNLDADPKLGPIADNGGAAPTLLPGSGSAAIDAGSCAAADDERGIVRPQGTACDIGAVEVVQAGSRARCYVWASASGRNDGTSWADAYTDLQFALRNLSCASVWVAKGVYKPVVPADANNVTGAERSVYFVVPPGMKVYGGFAGNEASGYDPTTDADRAANVAAHPTVLSGDIDGNDSVDADGIDADTTAIAGSNSLHVVVIDGTTAAGTVTASTVLDGFTVSGGNADADADQYPLDFAGGLYCNGAGAGHECSPSLSHLVFSGNHAAFGGAIYNNGDDGGASNPSLTDVALRNNTAKEGGAIFDDGSSSGASSPTLTNVTLSGNSAKYGGAIVNDGNDGGVSSPALTNVTFSGNSADQSGGAIYDSGISNGTSSPILTNVTFSGNSAGNYGGAIFNAGELGSHVGPTLTNAILWGDTASVAAPEIYNAQATPTIGHSIVQGSHGSGVNWDATLGSDGGGNIDYDPKLGALADNGGFTQTLLPANASLVIDAGDDVACPGTDQRGIVRPQGVHCDIGAVEIVSHTVGGSVSGLVGTGLFIGFNNYEQAVSVNANGGFTFPTSVADGESYTIVVNAQPTSPSQTCTVTNGASGTVSGANVTNIVVECATVNSYAIATTSNPAGAGTVTCTPNPVTSGGDSTCTATANADFAFDAFSGDCSGASCTLSDVTANKSVVANFHSTLERTGTISVRGIANGDTTPSAADGTDFGSTPVGIPVTHAFTIDNTFADESSLPPGAQTQARGRAAPQADGDLIVSSITSSNPAFTVSGGTGTIPAHASASFNVRFDASAVGAQTATITIASDDGLAPTYTFVITATATAAVTPGGVTPAPTLSQGMLALLGALLCAIALACRPDRNHARVSNESPSASADFESRAHVAITIRAHDALVLCMLAGSSAGA
ncbi:MAG: choice-of-anchor Q domain-containing protein [Rudaea sp.]|uniref:choice-of-anchor Q domain-containing protein n=1 Tax=Rudaea sp. TaxID=2136325 RepID=UPI0039E36029